MSHFSLSDPPPVPFYYRQLYLNRRLIHRERKQGSHDGTWLRIGQLEIPDRHIEYLRSSENELHVGWYDPDEGRQVASMIVDANLRAVVDSIHYGLSRRDFQRKLDEMAAQGIGHRCRDHECQFCQARILSIEDHPWSPQVYCPWCDSLNTTIDVPGLGDCERDYRLCQVCGMYSRPRSFTIGYFVFLIFHAEVSHDVITCCPGCMRPKAWKMLLGNLFGLLGLPLAFTQLIRSYRDSIKKGPFRGLDDGNWWLRRGRVEKALEQYWQIIERHPVNAGVLYNLAVGLSERGDDRDARRTLEMALDNCPNYPPAQRLMEQLEAAAVDSGTGAPPHGVQG